MIRYFLIDDGYDLWMGNVNLGNGDLLGMGIRRVPVYHTSSTPLSSFRQVAGSTPSPNLTAKPDIKVYLEGVDTSLSWSLIGSGRWYASSGQMKIYVQSFGDKAWRVSTELRLYGVKTDYRVVFPTQSNPVNVEFRRERYPCTVTYSSDGTKTVTIIGKAGDTSHRMGWLCQHYIDTTVPAGEAAGYDSEISEASQYGAISDLSNPSRGMDMIVGYDTMLAAPIVLARGAFAPLFDASVEVKVSTEAELLTFFENKVLRSSSALSGWPLFGDWPEQEGIKARCNENNHYFHGTALLRAVIRASSDSVRDRWWKIALASTNFIRDMAWTASGAQWHGKGLAPYSGPGNYTGHWVDSECLLMGALLGDYFCKLKYDAWLANALAATPEAMPGAAARETQVHVRMCRVAYAWTGNAAWKTKADAGEAAVVARYLSVPTDLCFWHPEALKEALYPDGVNQYGFWNYRWYPARPFGWNPVLNVNGTKYHELNTGPNGETGTLLCLHNADERIYRSKPTGLTLGYPAGLVYYLDVQRLDDLVLNFRFGQRHEGDFTQLAMHVYSPSNVLAYNTTVDPNGMTNYYDSYGNAHKRLSTTIVGAVAGTWRVEIRTHGVKHYKGISKWPETAVIPEPGITTWYWPAERLGPK